MKSRLSEFWRNPGLGVLAVVAICYGGSKPTLVFDRGLHDNGTVATNDTPVIRGTVDPLYALDELHIDYRPKTSTNALDYVRAYDGRTVDLLGGILLHIENCGDMQIWIWSEYVEPPPEHTNGEYRIDYVARPLGHGAADGPTYLMLRTPLVDGETGRRLSPPELPRPHPSAATPSEEPER